jgi:16S rRNA (cytosine967-C5)-methyltransferase
VVAPARKAAFDLLCAVTLHGAHSDEVLHSDQVSNLEERDRRLVTELLLGSLRWQLALDHYLAGATSRPLTEVDPPVRVALRLGAYQLWKMNRIPSHAAVHDTVDLAKASAGAGAARFVNAVLRSLARTSPWTEPSHERPLAPNVLLSFPEWLWQRWRDRFGEREAREYCIALNQVPRCTFRHPAARQPPEGCESSDIVPGAYVVARGPTPALTGSLGPVRIQDEASQLVAFLPPFRPGWHVWDACAAPGGKTCIVAEKLGDSGFVIASDRSRFRAGLLLRTLRERGIAANVVVADAGKSSPFRRRFDCVLVDIPCSGLGTLRRNPEIRWRFDPARLRDLQQTQRSIIEYAGRSVRVGGYLLYSTCSTEPEENEEVVQDFLKKNDEFRMVRPASPPGVERWLDPSGFLRTFPSSRLWDGFFAALMVRET